MKIRTITIGCELDVNHAKDQIATLGEKAQKIKQIFHENGYTIQTLRLSTQPWEQYLPSSKELPSLARNLQTYTTNAGFEYFNIGPTFQSSEISKLYDFFQHCSTGFCTSIICQHPHIYYDSIQQTASLIQKLSRLEPQGFANLRFAALCNIPPGTPFFPASYHHGPSSFTIGLENSDLVYNALSTCSDIKDAKQAVTKIIEKEYTALEEIAQNCSQTMNIEYGGLDGSICSSVNKEESIAYAFEHLNIGKFGKVGSCAIASIITDVIQHIPVKQIGYNGLMLPVLEDYGLSSRNMEHCLDIQSLLLYSSVCGTGLDTIPLPGSIHKKQLIGILLDVASLSNRLHKSLSARLLPIPGKKAGDPTEFSFDYFVNSIVMEP